MTIDSLPTVLYSYRGDNNFGKNDECRWKEKAKLVEKIIGMRIVIR
ncbi:MAG: hypothetical protein ACOZAR_02300 [Patescibacteria group bacterium]